MFQEPYIGLRNTKELLGVNFERPIYGVINIDGAGTSENSLNVNIKEIRTNLINEQMHYETDITTMFAIPPIAEARSFTVVDASAFSVGDIIQIEDGTVETDYPEILAIVGNEITINRPIDKTYTINDGIRKILVNMAVDGSVTPLSFKYLPNTTTSTTNITRMLLSLVHPTAGDMALFGNLDRLERGVLVRAWYKRTNEYKTITTWRTNQEMANCMYDVRFDTRSSGGGSYGTSGRWTFTNAGIVAQLDEGLPYDFIEILIQDDLTGLTSFNVNVQGHTED